MPQKPAPVLLIGLFFGALVGCFVTLAFSSRGTTETWDEYQKRTQPAAARRSDTAGPAPRARPPAGGAPPHAGGQPDRATASIAKVHFMKKFVKALTSMPLNNFPNAKYEALLSDPSNPIVCRDCHDNPNLNMDGMMRLDPGSEAVEQYRKNPNFMIPLMQNWVGRLNKLHAGRLREPVTCTSCHAVDPRERNRVLPPLMASFVNALREKPVNKNPAPDWKPLLKDPANKSMLCSVCHGRVGTMMERGIDFSKLERPAAQADDKVFMADLMERWVEKLNREGSELLTKAVVCLDCHETDPRR